MLLCVPVDPVRELTNNLWAACPEVGPTPPETAMPQPPRPRVKLPAQVRERVYRQAMALARSHADMMIAALERQLSAELAAAMQTRQIERPPQTGGLDTMVTLRV
jgi:hypothetical protein